MLTRSRNLLILAGLAIGATAAAGRVPAISRHYDSGLSAVATADSDCPYHRAHAAALRRWSPVTQARTASAVSVAPPMGSIFYPGRASIFAP
jgi:hypothetical protein